MYPYEFWARTLGVFDEVIVLARVGDAPLASGARRVDGPGVRVLPVADFTGSRGLARAALDLGRASWRATRESHAFILRAPGVVASALREALRVARRPYGIAVVGDPRQSLRAGDLPMRLLRTLAARQLREQVHGASASRFVTARQLQALYPPRAGTTSVAVSDVELPDSLFESPPIAVRPEPRLRVGFIGMMERPYKGLDTLIDALAATRLSHTLAIAGDGVLRAGFEARVSDRGLTSRVSFLGRLPQGEPIERFLRGLDLLVVPSRTEGLPRVLLEGMAVGLPALGTPVGGIPELLDPTELVPVGDAHRLASEIDALAADPARRHELGRKHQERARAFRSSVSRRELERFHLAVRAASQR